MPSSADGEAANGSDWKKKIEEHTRIENGSAGRELGRALLTVTGRSGSFMQKEQLKLLPTMSSTSSPAPSPSSSSASSAAADPARSSWRRRAFSWSERVASASMARMAATSSPPAAGAAAGAAAPEQSGQLHVAASESAGGSERQGECHGVAQVEHRSRSTSGGASARQTMQTPSPSQGRSGMAAAAGGESGGSVCARVPRGRPRGECEGSVRGDESGRRKTRVWLASKFSVCRCRNAPAAPRGRHSFARKIVRRCKIIMVQIGHF